jgi:putative phosphoesterase
MKILVLSDSHSGMSFMRRCVNTLRPDVLIHLGDYWGDGEVLHEEFPTIPIYRVPGNCDRYYTMHREPEIVRPTIGGVRFYLTHGHLHSVKMTTSMLLEAAKADGAQVVLYGHTHRADCRQEGGMWVLNPGACGASGGSVGLIRVEGGEILSCRVLWQADLEEYE